MPDRLSHSVQAVLLPDYRAGRRFGCSFKDSIESSFKSSFKSSFVGALLCEERARNRRAQIPPMQRYLMTM